MDRGDRKEKEGIVLSRKMNKTAIVSVERLFAHSFYKKVIKKIKKYKVHDENNASQAGDKVIISETRPISKDKRWRIEKIISQGSSR